MAAQEDGDLADDTAGEDLTGIEVADLQQPAVQDDDEPALEVNDADR